MIIYPQVILNKAENETLGRLPKKEGAGRLFYEVINGTYNNRLILYQ